MARYESILKLKGSIDDLVFYQLNGVNVVRKKSGFNSKDFKSKASYKKVRENSSEFGHCSKVGKMLREALAEYLKESGDKYLYQKFAKLMTEIKDLDTENAKGKRCVENGLKTAVGMELLKKFQFGEIENAGKSIITEDGLFSFMIRLKSKTMANKIDLVSLNINFKNYVATSDTKTIKIQQGKNTYEMEKSGDNSSTLLKFVVLKKDKEIIKMGFV